MANYLSRPVEELRHRFVFWRAIGMILLPFVLILKEPDLGSALILLPIGIVMLFVAGTPVHYLTRLIGAAGIVICLISEKAVGDLEAAAGSHRRFLGELLFVDPPNRRLCPVLNSDLAKDCLDVDLHGRLGDIELSGYDFVGIAFDQAAQN